MSDITQEIFSDKIDDPEFAMRTDIDRNALFELADNIKQNGLINPITVRPKNNRYEVVAGHRRFSACKINGMIRIPCVVRELDDNETFAVMAAENLERADVDPVDEANFIKEYMNKTGFDANDTAKKLRRSEQYVIQRLMVAEMPDYIKTYLKDGRLKLGVALALGQIENEIIREKWVHLAVEQGISVATAQFQLHDYKTNKSLYEGIVSESKDGGAAIVPKTIMFRCAIDDKEYDVRLCRTVIISEANYPLFGEFVRLYRSAPAEIS